MPNNAIRIGYSGAFAASPEHDPAFNDREAAVRINGGTRTRISLWNSDLYPAQNNTWAGVTNAVPERGSNSYVYTGGDGPTLINGGMSWIGTANGGHGLRLGITAAAGTPHDNDLSQWGDVASEFLWQGTIKRHTDNGGVNNSTLYVLSAAGALGSIGAKCQLVISATNTTGLRVYVGNTPLSTGWVPTVGKLYAIGVRLLRVPGGTDLVYLSVFNLTDNVEVYREARVGGIAHVAWEAMGSGGESIGAINSISSVVAPQGFAIYDVALSRLTTSGRDGLESHYDYVREMLSAVAAGKLS